MSVEKLSVSLDSQVAARARKAAAAEGVSLSTWLSAAAERAANLAEARAAWGEHFAEFGEPDEEAVAAAEADLESVGFWKAETPEHAAARRDALARLYGETPSEIEYRKAG